MPNLFLTVVAKVAITYFRYSMSSASSDELDLRETYHLRKAELRLRRTYAQERIRYWESRLKKTSD